MRPNEEFDPWKREREPANYWVGPTLVAVIVVLGLVLAVILEVSK